MSRAGIAYTAIVCWSFADVLLTLLFYFHFNVDKWNTFGVAVLHDQIASSSFDIFLIALLRCSLIVGCTMGRACSRDKQAANRRLNRLSPLAAITIIILMSYLVVKFLVSEEYDENGHLIVHPTKSSSDAPETLNTTISTADSGASSKSPHHPWLWGILGWSTFATAVAAGEYYFLCRVQDDFKPKGYERLVDVNSSAVNINSADLGKVGSDDNDEDGSDSETDSDSDSDSDTEMGRSKSPTDKKKRSKSGMSKKATVWRLLKLSKPDIGFIMAGFAFLAVAAASDTFQPYYFGQVIDSIAIQRDESSFVQAIIVICGLALASALGSGLRGMSFLIAMARVNVRIRNLLFGSLTRQEIGFFDTTRTGNVTSRLTSDTTKMSDQLSLNLNIFLRSSARGLGCLVFMFTLSWKLTLVVLLEVPIIALITHYYGKYYKKLSRAVQNSLAKANNVAEEVLSSMRTVRSFANENAERQRYSSKLKATFRLNVKQAVAYFGYQSTSRGLELLSYVGGLYYGGWLVIHGEVTAGHLVSFILYEEELEGALEDIGSVFTGLMQAVGAADKVFHLIDRQPLINHTEGSLKPEAFNGHVEFRNVSFAYPSRPDSLVLKNVSFQAAPGDVIAFVGPSGGGKTSCISLLERFYDPLSGSVLIDAKPLPLYDHQFLHTKISLVGQEPTLYACSVEENIAYGLTDIDHEKVKEAARLANAHDFIDAMDAGYATQTGEKGIQLSGGQKQRVAIARAVIRDPAILLLDEATSALDAESEHLVQDGLYRKMKDKTVLVVAHRLSTVENATRIIVIDKGVIVEQGTHDELLRVSGLYSRLVQRQLMPSKQMQDICDPQLDYVPSREHKTSKSTDASEESAGDESSSDSMHL